MSHWTFWEWVAYAAIFIAAAIIATDTGFRLSPEIMNRLPKIFKSAVWGFSPLILVLSATIILVAHEFGWIDRTPITAGQTDDPLAIMGYFGRPIAWSHHIFVNRDLNSITSLGFDGIVVQSEEVELSDAYAISGIDGKRLGLTLRFMDKDHLEQANPSEINPIPSGTPLFLVHDIQLTENEFRAEWNSLFLVVEYKDGQKQRISFNEKAVTESLSTIVQHPSRRD